MPRLLVLVLLTVLLSAWGRAQAPLTAEEARASSARAIELLTLVNTALGDEYFHSGEWEKAVAALERVMQLAPQDVNAYANAAWLLWSTKQTERALQLYRRMIENNPADPEAYYIFGQYHFGRQQYAEALPLLQRADELKLPSPRRHLLGHCLVKLNRPQDALTFWRRVLAEEPDNAIAPKEIQKLTAPPETPPAPAG